MRINLMQGLWIVLIIIQITISIISKFNAHFIISFILIILGIVGIIYEERGKKFVKQEKVE